MAADLGDKETQLQVLQDALQSAKAELEAQQYATVGIREVNEKERQDLAALRQQLELQYVIVPWRCVLGLGVRTHHCSACGCAGRRSLPLAPMRWTRQRWRCGHVLHADGVHGHTSTKSCTLENSTCKAEWRMIRGA